MVDASLPVLTLNRHYFKAARVQLFTRMPQVKTSYPQPRRYAGFYAATRGKTRSFMAVLSIYGGVWVKKHR